MKKQHILILNTRFIEGGAPRRMILFAKILKEKGHYVSIAGARGDLVSLINNNAIDFIELNINLSKGSFIKRVIYYIKTIFKIQHEIKERNIDIISNHSRYLSIMSFFVSKRTNIKFYTVDHGIKRNNIIMKLNCLWGQKILSVSDNSKKDLIENYNVKSNIITVVKNSMSPLNKLSQKEILDFKSSINLVNKRIVCCIALFSKVKGHIFLLKAWGKVIREVNNAHLILVGMGDLEKNIKLFIEENKLSNLITILPKNTNVAKVFCVSEFSILPSLREGLPTVVIESFSLGKSVVATNIPGTNEIAIDNYNSLLVSPKNVNEISSAIIKLFKNNDLRENLNKNAYNTYKKQFDFEQYKKKILNFYTS